MIKIDRKYKITDSHDREWGTVKLEWKTKLDFQAHENLHGYLSYTNAFIPVLKLFNDREAHLNSIKIIDGMDEFTQQIIDLKPIFHDLESNEICTPGIVVAQETEKGVLLTCEAK